MKSDLLPDEVTWYHLTGVSQGRPEYRRTVLSPVRCEWEHKRRARDGDDEGEAILYVFPDELHGTAFAPEPDGDYFVPGVCALSRPGGNCYRVCGVKLFDGIPRMRHYRIVGVGGGEAGRYE